LAATEWDAAAEWHRDEGIVPEFTFGDRLRNAREIAGLEQRDMAEKFGVSSGSVSNWEKGVSQPRDVFAVAAVWADVTGVQRHWLLTGVPLGG